MRIVPPPLSLYVHLPWCVKKCPYCDFNSHAVRGDLPRARYVDALLADLSLEARIRDVSSRRIDTIFLGGGTPSLFDGEDVQRIVDGIRSGFEVAADVEITLEANPGTTERDNLGNYVAAGVNRLSLGGQSFDDAMLQRLGRIHSSDDIRTACLDARAAGFTNINIDLMFALPGQTTEGALADLAAAIELEPSHISWYQLTLEPNTVFHARPPDDLPDDDLAWDMQAAGEQLLGNAGFEHYEISAYARPGFRCRHNLNYWTFGDYLAVGAGAHGKYTDAGGRVFRYRKPAHPLSYMQAAGDDDGHPRQLADDDLAFDFMLNALRLHDGFSGDTFSMRTGLPIEVLRSRLEKAQSMKLISGRKPDFWRPTERGLRFLNDLQGLFLPAEKPGG